MGAIERSAAAWIDLESCSSATAASVTALTCRRRGASGRTCGAEDVAKVSWRDAMR